MVIAHISLWNNLDIEKKKYNNGFQKMKKKSKKSERNGHEAHRR